MHWQVSSHCRHTGNCHILSGTNLIDKKNAQHYLKGASNNSELKVVCHSYNIVDNLETGTQAAAQECTDLGVPVGMDISAPVWTGIGVSVRALIALKIINT